MSGTAAAPVIAGLAVGIGFILILSLFPIGASQMTITRLSPAMSLVTTSDSKSYETHDNIYCGLSCDVLIAARVIPSPQIAISNDSEVAFRLTSTLGAQQPSDLHFIIQEIMRNDTGGNLEFKETNLQLAKTSNGNYRVENLPAGMYVINVIADWNSSEQNLDFSHSLHRFAVKVTTGSNSGNDPSSSLSEIKTDHSNRTVSIVVIPKGASSQSGKNFEPSIIKVVIGVNNTVRWANNDSVPSSVIADNTGEDPDFAAATQTPPRKSENLIMPGESFNFTFSRPGWINYHGESHPWMQGTVIILPPEQRIALTINGLKDTYKVGEIIDVSATQTGGGCGFPRIIVKDEKNQEKFLTSNGNGLLSCPIVLAEDLQKSA